MTPQTQTLDPAAPGLLGIAPIVLTPRIDLREAVRSELRALGWSDIKFPDTLDKCTELLVMMPQSLLVLDWEVGSKGVVQVLSAAKGRFHIETHPIFVLIPKVHPDIIATAAEYGVSQLHAGPVSRLAIRECVDAILNEDRTTREIREGLVRVANFRAKDDWAGASQLLSQMHANQAGNERIAIEYAENLIHTDHWDEAVALLSPLVALTPPRVRALHLMGRCRMKQGKPAEAISLLQKAKIINPHNVDRLIDLGNSFLHNDQVAEALRSFHEAQLLEPQNKSAKLGESQCRLLAGEVNEALALLKTISGPREMASIFNTAAVLSMQAGRFDKGMALYRSALGAIGKDQFLAARLMFNMGLGYRRWNKPDKAAQCFDRALAFDPNYEKARRQKEMTLRMQPGTSVPPAGGEKSHSPKAAQTGRKGGASDSLQFADEEFTALTEGRASRSKSIPKIADPLAGIQEAEIEAMEWDPDS